MDAIMVFLFVWTAIWGLFPPLFVFYLEGILSRKTLAKAEQIRVEAVRGADQVIAKTDKAVKDLKFLNIHAKNEIKAAVNNANTNIKVRIPEDQMEDLKKYLSDYISRSFNGQIGNEVKQLKAEVMNDPAAYEQFQAVMDHQGGGRGGGLMDRIVGHFLGFDDK